MREDIYIIVFTIGLICTLFQRYMFENVTKISKDKDYCNLYRETNNIYLVLFIVLIIDNVMQLH